MNGGTAARYALVGAGNTLLYSGVLYVLLAHASLPNAAAVTVAYAVAVPVHFFLNRVYVFGAGDRSATGQLMRYAVVLAASFLSSIFAVTICRDVLHFSPFATVVVNAIVTAAVGYVMSAVWVFR
jgi:putative flippase GtrA